MNESEIQWNNVIKLLTHCTERSQEESKTNE